jgi:hypothetical protein
VDIVKDVIVPVGILVLSIGFTIWRERSIRVSKKLELYIQQVETWVKDIIALCHETESFPYTCSIPQIVDEIYRISSEGQRLLTVKDINKGLRKAIAQTLDSCSVFKTFPEDDPTEEQRSLIKLRCDGVLFKTSDLRYK